VEAEPEPHVAAELLLLYVDQSRQRHGIGSALVTRLESALKQAGAAEYRVAVRKQLDGACAFYRASGFVFEQQRPVLGHPMAYFVRDL
jgi:ribosomal protein S18 acetylase RimI-like enzyme